MKPVDIVKSYYSSDLANDPNVISSLFHKDCEFHWTSSQGFKLLNFNDLEHYFIQTRKAYESLRFEFTHLIEANETVVTRHTLFGTAIENASNEMVLGHFSTIWEIKENKLYRAYEISHQADESDAACLASYTSK